MTKARDLANLIAAGNPLADGAIAYSEVTGTPTLGTAAAAATGDFATAAQGTLADAALPKAGGAVTGDVTFGDSDKIIMGAGSDLQIYHDGSHSLIKDSGTGNLKLLAENFSVQDPNQTEQMILATPNSSVNLYHNGSKKIETTALGCDITGRVAADFLVPASNQTDPDDGAAYIYQQSGVGWDFAALNLKFSTGTSGNRAERMRIDSGGNLGVGTASPSRKLTVQGGSGDTLPVRVIGGSGATTSGLEFQDPSTTADYKVQIGSIGDNLYLRAGGAEGMRITSSGDVNIVNELKAGSYNETYAALSGTSPAVNCETGNVFSLSTTGSTTFTFTNPPASGTAYGFTLKVTAGGTHTLTWPSTVDWAGGTAPDAPASGETNVLVFITYDGGTTWYGFQAGAALA